MANSNQQSGHQPGGKQNPAGGSATPSRSGSGRGFASMDSERQREIAAEGGRAAHASGNAHEFTSEEARQAGSKSHGGQGAQSSATSSGGSRSGAGGSSTGASGGARGGRSELPARAAGQGHPSGSR